MIGEVDSPAAAPQASYDYIVVGAGAGGGPLAANLAAAGMRVLLLEAGLEGGTDVNSDSADYAVPAFHGRASEDPATSWQSSSDITRIPLSRSATPSTSRNRTGSSTHEQRLSVAAPPTTR